MTGTRRLTLAFDGRLDNRAELIKLLEVGAVEALDLSDAQIALRAYSKWGEGCFDRFPRPLCHGSLLRVGTTPSVRSRSPGKQDSLLSCGCAVLSGRF